MGNFDHYAYGNFDHYAYGNKVRGAGEACRRQGIAFLPMVVESFGGWHEVAEREVRKLGAALARHTGQEESEAIGHLWGRLGVLVQRVNAVILDSSPAHFTINHRRAFLNRR